MEKPQEEANVNLGFLEQLTIPDKIELYRMGNKKIFAKNDFIFKAGDKGSHVWVLTQGRVKIFKSSTQGRDILLWYVRRGDIFGLAECLLERKRLVYARAAEATEGISISHTNFQEWLSIRPESSFILMKTITARMSEVSQRFLSLASGNIQIEIAQLLLRLGSSYGKLIGQDIHIDIPLTEQDIADMAGTSRQGVSSCMANMKRQGIIDCVRHFMIIKKLDQLKQMADVLIETRTDTKWTDKTSKVKQAGSRSILL